MVLHTKAIALHSIWMLQQLYSDVWRCSTVVCGDASQWHVEHSGVWRCSTVLCGAQWCGDSPQWCVVHSGVWGCSTVVWNTVVCGDLRRVLVPRLSLCRPL